MNQSLLKSRTIKFNVPEPFLLKKEPETKIKKFLMRHTLRFLEWLQR